MVLEKIVIGRDRKDLVRFGEKGIAYIGKHIVGEGEEAHLTNPICMDVIRPHVVLVCGKRGEGKSYTVGVIAEEITRLPQNIKQNLSVLFVDTMGIYWSMKNPNEKEAELLKEWGLKPQGLNIKFLAPKGFIEEYEKVGVKVDKPLTISYSDLTAQDWTITFNFSLNEPEGIAIERALKAIRKRLGSDYIIDDIVKEIEEDKKSEKAIKNKVINRFLAAEDWGIFERKGTPVKSLFSPGTVSILDVSHFVGTGRGWSVRGMLVGLFARKIYQERLTARKSEEFEVMGGERGKTIPMVWIMIDEAHMFIPSEGSTVASEPLLTLVKQGREPGISLLFITQIPNKLHPDALAQSDLVISHRLTAEADLKALRAIMQSYMAEDISEYINALPRQKGTAIVLDDNSERIYTVQIRPRLSWHAGGSPAAIKEKGLFD